jgi:acetyl esterase/lipase
MQHKSIRLWHNDAPGSIGNSESDVPALTLFPCKGDNALGSAIIICPGGGYMRLAEHEGKDYALWLNELGISCFVLKYRLAANGYRHPSMYQDVSRAVRLVRSQAKGFEINPNHVGIMGSSAGGHLASTLLTHFDNGKADSDDPIERFSNRPDLGILCYPVITMGPYTHEGSKKNLLGDNPSEELVKLLSNELQIKTETPPCFIWHTYEDKGVNANNSLDFAAGLQRTGYLTNFIFIKKAGMESASMPRSTHLNNFIHGLWIAHTGWLSRDL